MTHAAITYQQPLLGMISGDAMNAIKESYQAHRRKGHSDFAAHHAALGVFLDHVRRPPLWAAAKAVREIIKQT